MTKPVIVSFVGIPGSGKTTFARQLADELHAVLLNSDSIRLSMWKTLEGIHKTHAEPDERAYGNQLTFGALDYAAAQILGAGMSVVYDCNANKFSDREQQHKAAHTHGATSVVIRIEVPHTIALERVQHRAERHDQRRISAARASVVLDGFAREIEEPLETEKVIRISGDMPFTEQYAIFNGAMT